MHEIIDKKFYLGPKFGTLINKKWITISELLQYLKAIERGDRRSGAREDDRQGLPRFMSPRWRIATFCYNSL
jgi:hypothetical protein